MGTGLESFQRRLRAIPKAARAAVGPALVEAAQESAAAMLTFVPRDTGALAKSIAVTGPGASTPAYSTPGGKLIVPELTAVVTAGNTDVRYAHLVEYGTVKTAAQPFFFPGARLARARVTKALKRKIGKAIKDAK